MVLMQHGLFTFDDDPRRSYEMTIELVSKAEDYLRRYGADRFALGYDDNEFGVKENSLIELSELRRAVSRIRGVPVVARWNRSSAMVAYSSLDGIGDIGTRGPVTPDHSIRTKRIPLVLTPDTNLDEAVCQYDVEYKQYFARHQRPGMTCLDPAPRWVIWPNRGVVSFGTSVGEAKIIDDIAEHTAKVVQQAESLGGWCALGSQDVFDVEYWELEQAKLKTKSVTRPLQGRVALVTGAASGIGRACAQQMHSAGAAVIAADIDPAVVKLFAMPDFAGTVCDVSRAEQLRHAVWQAIERFGGLDIVVSNAGVFSQGENIETLSPQMWERSLQLNLTQHKDLMQASFPFLRRGLDATFIIIGSKNVAAPGPGASAYSVAKAGLNQLMRVAALEWGADSIRVNIIHPDCVYDTNLWSDNVLQERAAHYGMTVEQYKTRNLLRQSVTSTEVGLLAVALAGSPFLKTTGAQLPIDGGNDRVI
jgi:NAD(P)-dependent dehydrogenase (short-subunit alcohol dehydrogenase family)